MALSATALARVQGARDAAQVGDGRLVVGLLDTDGPARRRRSRSSCRAAASTRGCSSTVPGPRPTTSCTTPTGRSTTAPVLPGAQHAVRTGGQHLDEVTLHHDEDAGGVAVVVRLHVLSRASTRRPTPPRGRRRRGAPAGGPSGSWWAWGRHSSSLAARPVAMSARSSPLRGAGLATGGAARPEIAIALMSKVLQGCRSGCRRVVSDPDSGGGEGRRGHRLLGNPERIGHLSIGRGRRIATWRCHTPWGSWRHGPLVPARRRSAAARVVDAAAAGRVGGPARAGPVADPPRRLHADGAGRSRLAPGRVDLQAPRLPPRAQPRRHRARPTSSPARPTPPPTGASRPATSAPAIFLADLPDLRRGRLVRRAAARSPCHRGRAPTRRPSPTTTRALPRPAVREPPHAPPAPAPRRPPWPPHPHPGRPRWRARRAGGRWGR